MPSPHLWWILITSYNWQKEDLQMSFVTCISFQALHRNCRLSPSGPRKCTTLTVSFWFMQMLSTTVTKSTVGFIRTPPAPTRSAPNLSICDQLGGRSQYIVSQTHKHFHDGWLDPLPMALKYGLDPNDKFLPKGNNHQTRSHLLMLLLVTAIDCSQTFFILFPWTFQPASWSSGTCSRPLFIGEIGPAVQSRKLSGVAVHSQHSSEGPGISAKGMHQHTTHGKGVKWFPALLP